MTQHRICVLGGAGFVGRVLVNKLARAGHQVVVLTRHPERHRDLGVEVNIELRQANVHDEDALKTHFRGCDTVINLIGILNEAGRQNFQWNHTQLARKVVHAGHEAGVKRLLHMSALNADAAAGVSKYLRSKGEAENIAHTTGQPSMAVTSYRPSIIFGAGDGFFNMFAGLLRLSPFFPVCCPQARFAPVFVGDVAEAMVKTLDDPRSHGRHYTLCGPTSYSFIELVQFTAKTIGKTRWIHGLCGIGSKLFAKIMGFMPGKPMTYDNYLSMQKDSVCPTAQNDLTELGITPRSIESTVPAYLNGSIGERTRYQDMRRRAGR